MSEIEYFYSTHSIFAYLGSARFMEIARAAGCKIVHRPIDLNQTVPAVGSLPFRQRSPKHVAYFFRREIDRWAEERGASVMQGFPQYHHNDMAMCNGMIIAGVEQDVCMDQLPTPC